MLAEMASAAVRNDRNSDERFADLRPLYGKL
jgi:hypothetical protein